MTTHLSARIAWRDAAWNGAVCSQPQCALCRYPHNGHWTRHSSRLNCKFARKRWGDAGYAVEEPVAELGAAFLCADLRVTPEPRGGPRSLSSVLARRPEARQAYHLHRSGACREGCGFSV